MKSHPGGDITPRYTSVSASVGLTFDALQEGMKAAMSAPAARVRPNRRIASILNTGATGTAPGAPIRIHPTRGV